MSTAPIKTSNPITRVIRAAVFGAIVGVAITRWHNSSHMLDAIFHITPALRISITLWVIFSIYWSIAARKSASTQSSESKWSRGLHLFLANGALLLLILSVPGFTHRFLPDSRAIVSLGLAIQTAAFGLAVWTRQNLGANWSGEVRIAQGHQLVQAGPYKFLRHPIYTAVIGMYVGTMLVSGEIHAPIALAIMILAYIRKLRMEESALGATFGANYDAYRQHTWALIPPIY